MEEPDRSPAAGEVKLRTVFSGISAGTELSAYRGSNPYLHKRWDTAARLFLDNPEHESLHYPVVAWGYEEVGEVIETGLGVEGVPLGAFVYGTWGHRSHHIVPAAYARARLLPDSVDPLLGIFSQIGAIAFNGILDSAIRLGETVAVFGLGVVGQLAAQLAQLSGAEVIGVDLLPKRLELARLAGIARVLDGRQGSPGERIKAETGGRGADVCIEASGSTAALHEAIRACAYSSRVVTLGFFQGEARGLALGEEFHHNRIHIVGSQIGGVDPELQYRWNELRLVQTFMRLVAEHRVQPGPLITHVAPVTHAPELFRILDERPGEVLQVVLDFQVLTRRGTSP